MYYNGVPGIINEFASYSNVDLRGSTVPGFASLVNLA